MQVLNISWNNIQDPVIVDPQVAFEKKKAREQLLQDIENAEAEVVTVTKAAW